MPFVTRSKPDCKPCEQMRKPLMTTITIGTTCSRGSASIAPKAAPISFGGSPANAPHAVW